HRDAAAVVANRNAVVGVDLDVDVIGMAGQRLVDAVVHDLGDHVVQTRSVVGVADIHTGPFTDGFEALENLDGISAVFSRLRGGCAHTSWYPAIDAHHIERRPGNVTANHKILRVCPVSMADCAKARLFAVLVRPGGEGGA